MLSPSGLWKLEMQGLPCPVSLSILPLLNEFFRGVHLPDELLAVHTRYLLSPQPEPDEPNILPTVESILRPSQPLPTHLDSSNRGLCYARRRS